MVKTTKNKCCKAILLSIILTSLCTYALYSYTIRNLYDNINLAHITYIDSTHGFKIEYPPTHALKYISWHILSDNSGTKVIISHENSPADVVHISIEQKGNNPKDYCKKLYGVDGEFEKVKGYNNTYKCIYPRIIGDGSDDVLYSESYYLELENNNVMRLYHETPLAEKETTHEYHSIETILIPYISEAPITTGTVIGNGDSDRPDNKYVLYALDSIRPVGHIYELNYGGFQFMAKPGYYWLQTSKNKQLIHIKRGETISID